MNLLLGELGILHYFVFYCSWKGKYKILGNSLRIEQQTAKGKN
jgi:hypothetical protein